MYPAGVVVDENAATAEAEYGYIIITVRSPPPAFCPCVSLLSLSLAGRSLPAPRISYLARWELLFA